MEIDLEVVVGEVGRHIGELLDLLMKWKHDVVCPHLAFGMVPEVGTDEDDRNPNRLGGTPLVFPDRPDSGIRKAHHNHHTNIS